MIIYISSEENKKLIKPLVKKYEWENITEVMEKGSLNSFITDKLQVITSLDYMIIERSCIKENNQQLKDVIDTIRAIWNTHIILLEDVLQDGDGEYQKVIYQEGITSLYKYQDNLEENLEYLLKGEKIPAENVYSGTWIGIMSSNSGAGCTHLAIDLATCIAYLGQSVCYVEANESGDLGAMAEFYGFEQIEDNHYRKNNIDYWHQMIDPEKKFAILDIGKYSASKMEMFNQCKIKILVTDGKPYRMADALNVLRYVKDDNTRLWLNYLEEEEFNKVKEVYLGELLNPIGCVSFHKTMFRGIDSLYQDVLRGYIQFNPKKQSKLSFILKSDVLVERLQKNKIDKQLPEDAEETDEGSRMSEELPLPNEMTQSELSEELEAEPLNQETVERNGMTFTTVMQHIQGLEVEKDNLVILDSKTEYQKVKSSNSKVIKNLILLLGIVLSMSFGITHILPSLHLDKDESGVHQEAAELVDEELNINQDIKISVLEVEGADGYEVSYSTDKEFPKERTVVVEVQTADKAVESLTAGKTYYVRVRAFKFNENGTKVYGEYTEVQKIKT